MNLRERVEAAWREGFCRGFSGGDWSGMWKSPTDPGNTRTPIGAAMDTGFVRGRQVARRLFGEVR